jgi:hypothetical protein
MLVDFDASSLHYATVIVPEDYVPILIGHYLRIINIYSLLSVWSLISKKPYSPLKCKSACPIIHEFFNLRSVCLVLLRESPLEAEWNDLLPDFRFQLRQIQNIRIQVSQSSTNSDFVADGSSAPSTPSRVPPGLTAAGGTPDSGKVWFLIFVCKLIN